MFRKIDKVPLIIDVRDKQEHQASSLIVKENSINIPLNQLSKQIKKMKIKKDKQILVFCLSGKRSKVAKEILNDMGYTNVIDTGSYENLLFYI